jgi:PPM family protein phosphatase
MSMPHAAARVEAHWSATVGFLSDTGRSRERNEDSFAVHVPYGNSPADGTVDALFVVADGMGGHEAGHVASRLVTERVAAALTAPSDSVQDPPTPEPSMPERLERLLQAVNRELVDMAEARAIARGAGSTLTAAVLRDSALYLAHVGDSRCYRLRDGQLTRLTEDHSWVAEQQRAGLITADEAEQHPQRNILTQCLGLDRTLQVFSATEQVRDGDRYLLCTDGLHGVLNDDAIGRTLMDEPRPQSAARRLIDLANAAGGPDNITAIVVDLAWRAPLAVTEPGTLRAMPAPRHRAGAWLLVTLGLLLLAGALAAGALLFIPDRDSPIQDPTTVTPVIEPDPTPASEGGAALTTDAAPSDAPGLNPRQQQE